MSYVKKKIEDFYKSLMYEKKNLFVETEKTIEFEEKLKNSIKLEVKYLYRRFDI